MPTGYVSRERVVIYLMLEDLQGGERRHAYHISPRRIREVAGCFGEVVHAVVSAPAGALGKHRMYADFVSEGFRPLTILGSKIQFKRRSVSDIPEDETPESVEIPERTSETTTLVRTSSIQSPASGYLVEDARIYGASIAVIVVTHDLNPATFDQLRKMGVKIVILAPDHTAGIRASRAVAWINCRDVADDRGDWRRRVAPLMKDESLDVGRYHAAPDFMRQRERASDRLAEIDPETLCLLGQVTDADDETRETVFRKLRSLAKENLLPSIVLASLFILAAVPPDMEDDRHLDKHAYYRRILASDIDLDVVGRFALDLLTEKGVLERIEFSANDAEYRFAWHTGHPAHALAREFCAIVLGVKSLMDDAEAPAVSRMSRACA